MTNSARSPAASPTVNRRTVWARIAAPAKALGGWTACVVVAVLHALALSLLSPDDSATTTLRDWALLMLPAIITVIAMPSTLRHWRRWAAFACIVLISSTAWTLLALVVAESWVLHREWVVDAYRGELSRLVPRWLRRGRSGRPRLRDRRESGGTRSAGRSGKGRPRASSAPGPRSSE